MILFLKMGNDLLDENVPKDIEPIDYSDDYIRYGVISKKNGEKTLDDTYLSFPNISSTDDSQKKIEFSLFGVFDGHNNDYVSKYLSNNIQKLYQKEINNIIKDNNYKTKIEEIFKTIDKNIKEEQEKKEKDNINENVINDNENSINEIKENENKNYINVGVDEREVNLFKDIIKNTKEIPEDLKQVDDSQIKDLILFKNLFKYNNNYLYNNNNVNYIGSSASVVLIDNKNVITADLGITTCVIFNKNGEIKNIKDEKNTKDLKDLKEQHTFNNKEEKRRIKKFNKEIDYNNLKINIYVPASRCFGLYKYKNDEILKEENQIISCVPDINIYDKNNVDFILLMTRGMINLIGDNLKKLIEKIINELSVDNEDDKDKKESNKKISELIEEYIIQREKEDNTNNKNNNTQNVKNPTVKSNSTIYVGKEDFAEENEIINELNNNYYKDIMNLNKKSDNYTDKFNITCILIQLLKKKKTNDENEIKDDENKNIIIEEKNIIIDEGKKVEEEKKEKETTETK